MADPGSLGVRAQLSKVLSDEHADLLREGVALVLREVMELEVGRLAGAERYERAEERASYRNGYRPRRFDTRVGTIELEIPKLGVAGSSPVARLPPKAWKSGLFRFGREGRSGGRGPMVAQTIPFSAAE